MPIAYVYYDLRNGYIHNWLTVGPQAIPIVEPKRNINLREKEAIVLQYYDTEHGITTLPVERGPLRSGLFKLGEYEGSWSYTAAREDHRIEHTAYTANLTYIRSWAYTQVKCRKPRQVSLSFTTEIPADIWLNGDHIHRQAYDEPGVQASKIINVTLRGGVNKIVVRLATVDSGECSLAFSLRVCHPVEDGTDKPTPENDLQARIPTLIENLERRNQLERSFMGAYTDRNVYSTRKKIALYWSEDLDISAEATVRLQTPEGQIYAQADVDGTPGDQLFLNYTEQIPDGRYQILLMPRHWEYYNQNLRFTHMIGPLWNLASQEFSETSYGTIDIRRLEALEYVLKYSSNFYAEIAKMKLGRWSEVNPKIIEFAIKSINQEAFGSTLELVSLLAMFYRFGQHAEFPQTLKNSLEDCFIHYDPASNPSDLNEHQQLLQFSALILAGQLYPDRIFTDGQTGQWHRLNAEKLATEWMYHRGIYGFEEWDSPQAFACELIALSCLIDLSQTEQVWEMATVMMDKLLLSIAMNSYQGVFGSTQGCATGSSIRGGLLQETAGITRLLWGVGIFNQHPVGLTNLACMEQYSLPPIIEQIALAQLPEFWNRERHQGKVDINKVTYKTPDYMLGSVQDYLPGTKGQQQHLWQATLSTEAVVFVNHPANLGEYTCMRGNWLGNAVLPRIAQWKGALVAIYNLPEEEWPGYTHAYFPIYAFDEYAIQDGWAFARRGEGYLAITAAKGIALIRKGETAYRELRSYGQKNVWLCQMGRAAIDGNFQSFIDKILTADLTIEDLFVRWQTLQGDSLSFGWEGCLLINNREQPLAGYKHYDNLYTVVNLGSTQMEVQYGTPSPSDNAVMRLDFGIDTDSGSPNIPS